MRAEAMISAVEPCFALRLDRWNPGHGPHPGPAGWGGGGTPALQAHVSVQPSAIHPSHCHLMLVPQ